MAQSQRSGGKSVAQAVIQAAADALAAWDRGRNLDDLLDELPSAIPRRIVASLLFASFRRRRQLLDLLARFAARADVRLQPILLAALSQALTQRGLPPPVAVDVAVGWIRRQRGRGPAGYANAVLRRCLEATAKEPVPVSADLLPPLIAMRWRQRFDKVVFTGLAELFQQETPLTCRVRNRIVTAELAEAGTTPLDLPPWAGGERFMAVAEPAGLFSKGWLERGDLYIQDPATVLAPGMWSAPISGLVLDLCSAPGGKSLLLAERLGENGFLVAADISARRHRRTVANFAAAGMAARSGLVVADARRPQFRHACAGVVLLDVPCTNTAVFRRRPDALWRFTEQRLTELVQCQRELLDAAAPLVRTDGGLIYSTCSLESEENEQQVGAFLQRHPEYELVRQESLLPTAMHDGAYAALLRRR